MRVALREADTAGKVRQAREEGLEKSFQEISKKVLTKPRRCGIIVKLSARGGTVIEN